MKSVCPPIFFVKWLGRRLEGGGGRGGGGGQGGWKRCQCPLLMKDSSSEPPPQLAVKVRDITKKTPVCRTVTVVLWFWDDYQICYGKWSVFISRFSILDDHSKRFTVQVWNWPFPTHFHKMHLLADTFFSMRGSSGSASCPRTLQQADEEDWDWTADLLVGGRSSFQAVCVLSVEESRWIRRKCKGYGKLNHWFLWIFSYPLF